MIGGYRWTEGNRLIVIPHRQSWRESHVVWEVDPATGEARRLTDPDSTPFSIANYDWDLAPDGSQLVYVSTVDKAMWRLDLGAPTRGRQLVNYYLLVMVYGKIIDRWILAKTVAIAKP